MSFCTPSCGYVSIAEKSILRSMRQARALGFRAVESPALSLHLPSLLPVCFPVHGRASSFPDCPSDFPVPLLLLRPASEACIALLNDRLESSKGF